MTRLENWSVTKNNDNPFLAPELRTVRLHGNIYEDEKKRFMDGTPVSTSRLCELDIENKIAQTKNTTYQLGEPSKEFMDYLNKNGYTLDQYALKEED